MKGYELFSIYSHMAYAAVDLDNILKDGPRMSSIHPGYNPIERVAQFLEDIKNNPNIYSDKIRPVFEAITGINMSKITDDCRRGISRTESAEKQNPKIYFEKISELQVQLDLGIKELRDAERLPKNRLENLRDFCVDLGNELISHSENCVRYLATG